jgi:hypothetical protein
MTLKKNATSGKLLESQPKNTLQGSGKNTKYASTSRNKARKKSRGQG